jgi:hypothetical protein
MDGRGDISEEATRVGRSIGGWRLEARAGEGQSGPVYAARDGSGRRGRLVVAGRNLAASASASGRWLGRLAHLRRAVEHAALLPCLDAGREAALCYAVEAEPGGASLAQALKERPAPWPQELAVAVAIDIAGALAALHAAGVQHGAVEPNCIHRQGETWRLGGCTWACWVRDEQRRRVAERETAAVAWLPAAVSQGRDPVVGDDIHAWGQLLHVLLHGHAHGDGPLPTQEGQDVGLQAIIADALGAAGAADVDIGLLAERLQQKRRQQGGSSRRLLLLGIAAAAFVALLLGVWFLNSGGSQREPAAQATKPNNAVQNPTSRPATPSASTPAVAVTTTKPPEVPVPSEPRPAWANDAGRTDGLRWAELRVAGRSLRFRHLPAASYLMGSETSDPNRSLDEEFREVRLTRGFWLAECETDQALYQAVTNNNPSHFRGPELPVERVSWDEVQQFLLLAKPLANGAALRLPTEAEWEWAARSERRHPGRTVLPVPREGDLGTKAVLSLPPSPDGLRGLLGNVMEWVQDAYGPYDRLAIIDPLGRDGFDRVARGGAWNLAPADCRPSGRSRFQPFKTYAFLGFRLAIDE